MNLLTERDYYKPFNYPWAFEHYKTQQHMHWLPDEVNLADDLKDYREKLTPENRRLINQIFRFLRRQMLMYAADTQSTIFRLLNNQK